MRQAPRTLRPERTWLSWTRITAFSDRVSKSVAPRRAVTRLDISLTPDRRGAGAATGGDGDLTTSETGADADAV
jgi:hypothetical protein